MKNCYNNKCKGSYKGTKTTGLKKQYGSKYFGIDRTYTCNTCNKSVIIRTTQ